MKGKLLNRFMLPLFSLWIQTILPDIVEYGSEIR